MRVIVVGLGVQGRKRCAVAGAALAATVDPVNGDADYADVRDVPLETFDAALVCTPDAPKMDVLTYLAERGKHALVEKPLWASTGEQLSELEKCARANSVVIYTAYNHRFEPHFVRAAEAVRSGRFGRVYSCRMFYGNGTARLVRDSEWRDTGAGVLPDLGSHLLDTAAFWFGDCGTDFRVIAVNRFENQAPDHVIIGSESMQPRLELEMTLLMWRNHFTCDILCENGSIHLRSLCKWGPATYTERYRVLPSGRPDEVSETLVQSDPTWHLEYDHFKKLCQANTATDLSKDVWLHSVLEELSQGVTA